MDLRTETKFFQNMKLKRKVLDYFEPHSISKVAKKFNISTKQAKYDINIMKKLNKSVRTRNKCNQALAKQIDNNNERHKD